MYTRCQKMKWTMNVRRHGVSFHTYASLLQKTRHLSQKQGKRGRIARLRGLEEGVFVIPEHVLPIFYSSSILARFWLLPNFQRLFLDCIVSDVLHIESKIHISSLSQDLKDAHLFAPLWCPDYPKNRQPSLNFLIQPKNNCMYKSCCTVFYVQQFLRTQI